MKRLAFLAALACTLAAPAGAQAYTSMCAQERFNVICRVQILNFPRMGDPVYVVSVNVVRTVASSRVTALVRATDCGVKSEQRNYMTLGTSAGGVVAQFNWPVAMLDTPRRCIEIEMSECRTITDEAVMCGAVISHLQSRASVRF